MSARDLAGVLFAEAPALESLPPVSIDPACGASKDAPVVIDLWYCHYESIAKSLLSGYPSLLLGDENQKWNRFRFEKDRNQYLVTRAMMRTVLSRYCNVSPMELRFRRNEHDKPALEFPPADVSFNISNTRGLIVVAVTQSNVDLGVDVESVVERDAPMEVAQQYFSSEERAALSTVTSRRKVNEAFFTLWTLKEAYIKARGGGLSVPLNSFSILPRNPPVLKSMGDNNACRFACFRTSRCLGAVAVQAVGSGQPDAVLRATHDVPGHSA